MPHGFDPNESRKRTFTRFALTPRMKLKTTLCRSVNEGVPCKFGERCRFAHSKNELRQRKVNPRFKTRPCREFNCMDPDNYLCYHGEVCSFHHQVEDMATITQEIHENMVALAQFQHEVLAGISAWTKSNSICESVNSDWDSMCDPEYDPASWRRTSTPTRRSRPFPLFETPDTITQKKRKHPSCTCLYFPCTC